MNASAPANTPKLGQGNITIDLGNNETIELRPTIHAVTMISRQYGGLQDAADRVAKLDFNAIVDILAFGGGQSWSSNKGRQKLMERVFAMGLTDDTGGIAFSTHRYLISLMRGGKVKNALDEKTEDETEAGTAEGNG